MADFEHRQLEIGLEFVCLSFPECNNFSKGSSEPNKDTQVIRVRGAAAPRVLELELLVLVLLYFISIKNNVIYNLTVRENVISRYVEVMQIAYFPYVFCAFQDIFSYNSCISTYNIFPHGRSLDNDTFFQLVPI